MSDKKLRPHSEISQDYSKMALQFGDLAYKNKSMEESIGKMSDAIEKNSALMADLKLKMDALNQEKFEPGTEPKPPKSPEVVD